MSNYLNKCIALLNSRGVTLDDIAECARFLQEKYHEDLKASDMMDSLMSVLEKREVQFAIMTAVELDMLAEKGLMFNKDLEAMLMSDEGLFGVDEVIAYGICNLYGSIALTNFGFIDKEKYGIIRKLNEGGKNTGTCNTFIDDVVGAIAAATASHFAHN